MKYEGLLSRRWGGTRYWYWLSSTCAQQAQQAQQMKQAQQAQQAQRAM
jgi:hypothetical protein